MAESARATPFSFRTHILASEIERDAQLMRARLHPFSAYIET
jgi:hypothetical protein